MTGIRQNAPGVLACLAIAVPAWFLGKLFPVVGGAVIAILAGMAVTMVWKHKGALEQGIGFPSKKVLQWAVVLLGFGLDLTVILQTGRQSLPIIVPLGHLWRCPARCTGRYGASVITTVAVGAGDPPHGFIPARNSASF